MPKKKVLLQGNIHLLYPRIRPNAILGVFGGDMVVQVGTISQLILATRLSTYILARKKKKTSTRCGPRVAGVLRIRARHRAEIRVMTVTFSKTM